MSIRERLEKMAERVGLTWDEVKDLSIFQFIERLESRRAGGDKPKGAS